MLAGLLDVVVEAVSEAGCGAIVLVTTLRITVRS